jgi:predicted metal-binding membrane protein
MASTNSHAKPKRCENPIAAPREREGPDPQGREGEGRAAAPPGSLSLATAGLRRSRLFPAGAEEGLVGLLARDRAIILAGLGGLSLAGWAYLLWLVYGGADMALMGMPLDARWTAIEAGFAFVMWAVMMVAMMLPSATPVVLLFVALERRRGRVGRTAAFVAGYLVLWSGFSAAAAALQWALQRAAITDAAAPTLGLFGAALVGAAGLYQLTPLKRACLAYCRSPVDALAGHWRPGRGGAFVMGARHGLYCLGCCWLLMALLFVTGVMNLLWVALLALVVLAEKLAPGGARLARWSGVALLGFAAGLAASQI